MFVDTAGIWNSRIPVIISLELFFSSPDLLISSQLASRRFCEALGSVNIQRTVLCLYQLHAENVKLLVDLCSGFNRNTGYILKLGV